MVQTFTNLVDALDDRDAALAILHRALEPPVSNPMPPNLVASWADHLGDTDLALASLRRWFDQTGRVHSSIWTPELKNTRRTVGFQELVRDYGLLDYWRETGNWGDFCKSLGDEDFDCV